MRSLTTDSIKDLNRRMRREVAQTIMAAVTNKVLYSFEDYLQWDEEPDNFYELVDEKLELINPPTFRHILIAKFLERELNKEINRL